MGLKMPRYDRTGPRGKGPRTGRGRGNCIVENMVKGNKDPVGKIVKNILGDDDEYECEDD